MVEIWCKYNANFSTIRKHNQKLRTKTHVCGQLKVGRFNVRAAFEVNKFVMTVDENEVYNCDSGLTIEDGC